MKAGDPHAAALAAKHCILSQPSGDLTGFVHFQTRNHFRGAGGEGVDNGSCRPKDVNHHRHGVLQRRGSGQLREKVDVNLHRWRLLAAAEWVE
jgi:hypothetical protein